MACSVGIMMDPEERKRYWRSRYRSFRNWRIVGHYNFKKEAQKEVTRLAEIWGCEAPLMGWDQNRRPGMCMYLHMTAIKLREVSNA